LQKCEALVEQHWEGFVTAGIALEIINRKRIYRQINFESFQEYCRERWGLGRSRAHQLISAASVVANVHNCGQIESLPMNEAQARPLAKLDREQQGAAWQRVVKESKGKRITAERVQEVVKRFVDAPLTRTFNSSNESIDWAKWSWNPVTGCKYDCGYCYARVMAGRFATHYPQGFEPYFYEERLAAPQNTRIPPARHHEAGIRNVFVCSMGELFGDWVAKKWIDRVLAAVRKSPQWNYIFLTKNPSRLVDIEWPKNAWVGTTVDRQSRVAPAVAAFKKIKATVRFVSCEPLLEAIKFPTLKCFDWLIIGAQSGHEGASEVAESNGEEGEAIETSRAGVSPGAGRTLQPDRLWVRDLVEHAWRENKQVYCKPNLRALIREYPQERPDV
jgi:protein gp37